MKKHVLAVLGVFATIGCGAQDAEAPAARQTGPTLAESRATYTSTATNPPLGIIEPAPPPSGVVQTSTSHWFLRYDPDSACVYVEPVHPEEAGAPRFLPFWPKGAEPVVRDGRTGVRTSRGTILQDERFTSAAWELSAAVLERLREKNVVGRCLTEGMGAVEIHL